MSVTAHSYMGQPLPFDVYEDPYTQQVRLTYRDYHQAISYETWHRAKAERGMMDRLIENFMEQCRRNEKMKYSQMAAYAMNPLASQTVKAKPLPLPKAEPKKDKTLLLCDV